MGAGIPYFFDIAILSLCHSDAFKLTSAGDFQPQGKREIALIFAYVFVYTNKNSIGSFLAKALAYVNANTNALAFVYVFVNVNVNAIDEFINYVQWSEQWQIYRDLNPSGIIATLEKLKQEIPDDEESIEVRQAFGQCLIQKKPQLLNLFRSCGFWLVYEPRKIIEKLSS